MDGGYDANLTQGAWEKAKGITGQASWSRSGRTWTGCGARAGCFEGLPPQTWLRLGRLCSPGCGCGDCPRPTSWQTLIHKIPSDSFGLGAAGRRTALNALTRALAFEDFGPWGGGKAGNSGTGRTKAASSKHSGVAAQSIWADFTSRLHSPAPPGWTNNMITFENLIQAKLLGAGAGACWPRSTIRETVHRDNRAPGMGPGSPIRQGRVQAPLHF